MITENTIQLSDYANLLASKDTVSLEEYLATYKSRKNQNGIDKINKKEDYEKKRKTIQTMIQS